MRWDGGKTGVCLLPATSRQKARKGAVSAIEGRGLIAVAPITVGELIAIKGGHIVTTAALAALPERLRNSEESRSRTAFTWPPCKRPSTSR